jgi:hypothetical protein
MGQVKSGNSQGTGGSGNKVGGVSANMGAMHVKGGVTPKGQNAPTKGKSGNC